MSVPQKYQDDLADLPQNRGSLNSVVYSAFTAILFGAGASYLLQPEVCGAFMLVEGRLHLSLLHGCSCDALAL